MNRFVIQSLLRFGSCIDTHYDLLLPNNFDKIGRSSSDTLKTYPHWEENVNAAKTDPPTTLAGLMNSAREYKYK
jgi:hypothetical protein